MADIVVGSLVDSLTSILANEAHLLFGVEGEAKSLEDYLRLIQAALEDYYQENNRNERRMVTEYMIQMEDLVREAEDVIDGYAVNVAQRRAENIFKKIKDTVMRVVRRRSDAEKISDVTRKFETLQKRKVDLGIDRPQQSGGGSSSSVREDLSWVGKVPLENTDVVGFDEEEEMIIIQLKMKYRERGVIVIEGMSGIGKSTLAGKVFHNPDIISHFDRQVWVCVSKYDTRELLETLLKKVTDDDLIKGKSKDDLKGKSNEDLGLQLVRTLKDARYLIVLDDVWDRTSWDNLQRFLPKNNCGSRIVVTTQIKEVALYASDGDRCHHLKFLSEENSWNLLSKKVFRQGQKCPDDLLRLGKEIANKCGGLPLAIVVMAGVLRRREKTEQRWSNVASNVSTIFNDERKKQTEEIFAISYDNLPHHLRPCFHYMGHFPEGCEIAARQLTTLWIAEGFVRKMDHKAVEEVAEEYLEELIDRNLIQLSENKNDWGVKSLRIHDLLRLFSITKAMERKELTVHKSPSSSSPCNSRRLATHSNTLACISSHPPTSNVRSLLCFGDDDDDKRVSSHHWKLLYKGYKLIRVLDLWGVGVDKIPSDLEKLICLRYLRLKSDSATTLPPTICNLWNLLFLEIKAPCINQPRVDIWKMPQLRHFYFKEEALLPEPPKRMVDCPTNVQTLSNISPACCTESVLSAVRNLVKLGIYGNLEKYIDLLFNSLPILTQIRKLKLVRDYQCPKLSRFPNSVQFPPTIIQLTISQTELSVDPMDQLGHYLPNLRVLKLIDNAYSGEELDCTGDSFPELRVLKLKNLGLASWRVSIGSMPKLTKVVISSCASLTALPSSLKDRLKLQEMQLWWLSAAASAWARDIEACLGKEKFKLLIYHGEEDEDNRH